MSLRLLAQVALIGFVLAGCHSAEEAPGSDTSRAAATADDGPRAVVQIDAAEAERLRLTDDGPLRWAHRFESEPPEWGVESDTVRLQTNPFNVIWEVSDYRPGTLPTAEQRSAAEGFVERCYESAKRNGWDVYETGIADGYQLLPGDSNHYRRNDLLLDDALLDPERPEVLMYYRTPGGQKLAGYMFHTSSRFARGEQFGGPLTLWHYHIWSRRRCVDDSASSHGFIENDEGCDPGFVAYQRSYEMIHVWLIDRPGGPFSTSMMVGQKDLLAGLEKRMRERGF